MADPLGRGWLAVTAFVLAALLACSAESVRRPAVVVSVLPQAWLVERLAGDLVTVEVMIPPGASHATYEPTMAQMRAVSRAGLYVKVGHPAFPFERAWLDRLLRENSVLLVVDASANIPQHPGDPHIWTSPDAMRQMASTVGNALADLLPDRRDELERNRTALIEEIATLDQELRRTLAGAEGRSFLVFHPAWGYFAEHYGLRQVAIEERGKEPGPLRLARLIEWARQEKVRAVLVQPQFSHMSAELIAREIGAELVTVDPLSRDWPASLRGAARAIADQAPAATD